MKRFIRGEMRSQGILLAAPHCPTQSPEVGANVRCSKFPGVKKRQRGTRASTF